MNGDRLPRTGIMRLCPPGEGGGERKTALEMAGLHREERETRERERERDGEGRERRMGEGEGGREGGEGGRGREGEGGMEGERENIERRGRAEIRE